MQLTFNVFQINWDKDQLDYEGDIQYKPAWRLYIYIHFTELLKPISHSYNTTVLLKGQCHEIFCFWFFSCISFPQAPEYTIRAVSNFFENLRRYSQLKVDHRYQRHRGQICPQCQRHRQQNCRRYQRHRWQICHRYQRHRRHILLPVSVVLLIPVAAAGVNDTGGK